MPKVQKDKYDILAEVALALRVKNRKVTIETLSAKDFGHVMLVDNLPHIPTHRTNTTFNGVATISRLWANSIKIGKDISIKRIRRRPSYIEQNGQRYEVDNGWYYVVRTPKGEAKFEITDNDFMSIWNKHDVKRKIDKELALTPPIKVSSMQLEEYQSKVDKARKNSIARYNNYIKDNLENSFEDKKDPMEKPTPKRIRKI